MTASNDTSYPLALGSTFPDFQPPYATPRMVWGEPEAFTLPTFDPDTSRRTPLKPLLLDQAAGYSLVGFDFRKRVFCGI